MESDDRSSSGVEGGDNMDREFPEVLPAGDVLHSRDVCDSKVFRLKRVNRSRDRGIETPNSGREWKREWESADEYRAPRARRTVWSHMAQMYK